MRKRLIDDGVDVNNKDSDGRTVLEFIIVHELIHLLERHHNERFKGLMDNFMPQWRVYENYKEDLNHA